MRISTLMRKLAELKEIHGDILVCADIDEPAKSIIDNAIDEVHTIDDLQNFYELDLHESVLRNIEMKISVETFRFDGECKSKKCAVLKLK